MKLMHLGLQGDLRLARDFISGPSETPENPFCFSTDYFIITSSAFALPLFYREQDDGNFVR